MPPQPSSAHFDNFDFDPSLFPAPPLPSSADLFSAAETSDLFGFLDTFGAGWDDPSPLSPQQLPFYASSPRITPYSNPHLNTIPEPSATPRSRPRTATRPREHSAQGPVLRTGSRTPSSASESSGEQQPSLARSNSSGSNSRSRSATIVAPIPVPAVPPIPPSSQSQSTPTAANKPLLSTPQKRLNHIMSEQKRRNAIRDGYAQLIAILAPAGAESIGMPQRGRPKGSGGRGNANGKSKGKSGVLFRAVEYIKWLEEGSNAMRREVNRVEGAAVQAR
uniref:BHLH domain-containing protein n=1 Tax=Mycena chlorophos TaxID=658473 RepID=A0ABQ0M5R8_MYCCL|nr:predicted protein [Mycena chlorophos]